MPGVIIGVSQLPSLSGVVFRARQTAVDVEIEVEAWHAVILHARQAAVIRIQHVLGQDPIAIQAADEIVVIIVAPDHIGGALGGSDSAWQIELGEVAHIVILVLRGIFPAVGDLHHPVLRVVLISRLILIVQSRNHQVLDTCDFAFRTALVHNLPEQRRVLVVNLGLD